jgi:hypothetical protein
MTARIFHLRPHVPDRHPQLYLHALLNAVLARHMSLDHYRALHWRVRHDIWREAGLTVPQGVAADRWLDHIQAVADYLTGRTGGGAS